jgi:FAD synthase
MKRFLPLILLLTACSAPVEISGIAQDSLPEASYLGRQTVTLPLGAHKILKGGYACIAHVDNGDYPAMCYSGIDNPDILEVHFFEGTNTPQGKSMSVTLGQRIRHHRAFESAEAMDAQLHREASERLSYRMMDAPRLFRY